MRDLKLEVLLATMNQKNDDILERMKVNTDVLVCNQNDEKMGYKTYKKNRYTVRWYDFMERGVGLNRNNALLRSTSDICLLADDDVIYIDGYEKIVINEFIKHPDVDVILFNIQSPPEEHRYICKKTHYVHLYNCGKYGAVRIAFKRNSIIKNAITFNQLFGGGAMFSAGEDNMFIRDCIRKKLKVIAVEPYILKLDNFRPSTWRSGYNKKYFEDMGSSYVYHYHNLAGIFGIIQLIRRRHQLLKEVSLLQAYIYILRGIKKYRLL